MKISYQRVFKNSLGELKKIIKSVMGDQNRYV